MLAVITGEAIMQERLAAAVALELSTVLVRVDSREAWEEHVQAVVDALVQTPFDAGLAMRCLDELERVTVLYTYNMPSVGTVLKTVEMLRVICLDPHQLESRMRHAGYFDD